MNKRDFFVVVVEDDDSLRSEIAHLVASVGFRTREASCAEELDEIAVDSVPSLLVLDIGLPGEDGLSICRRYTESIPGLTAVVLTARAGRKTGSMPIVLALCCSLPNPSTATSCSRSSRASGVPGPARALDLATPFRCEALISRDRGVSCS
jgi:CheY-like chemotaxis protein